MTPGQKFEIQTEQTGNGMLGGMFWCSPGKKQRDSRDVTPTPSEVEKNPEERTDAESCLPLESSVGITGSERLANADAGLGIREACLMQAHRSRRLSYHTAKDSSFEPGPPTVEREEVVRMLASNNDQLMQHMEVRMEAIVLESNNKLEAKIMEKVKTEIQMGRESSADQSTEVCFVCSGTSP